MSTGCKDGKKFNRRVSNVTRIMRREMVQYAHGQNRDQQWCSEAMGMRVQQSTLGLL